VLRTGLVGAEADDAVDDFLTGADTVETAGVTAEPEDLPGAREQRVVASGDAQGPAFGTPVSPIVGDVRAVDELGVGAGQQPLRRLQGEGLVPLQHQRVVGVECSGDQTGGLLVRVQRVEGEHHPGHVQGVSRSAITVVSPRLSGTWRCPRTTARPARPHRR
jgi:hypothetical protein